MKHVVFPIRINYTFLTGAKLMLPMPDIDIPRIKIWTTRSITNGLSGIYARRLFLYLKILYVIFLRKISYVN